MLRDADLFVVIDELWGIIERQGVDDEALDSRSSHNLGEWWCHLHRNMKPKTFWKTQLWDKIFCA